MGGGEVDCWPPLAPPAFAWSPPVMGDTLVPKESDRIGAATVTARAGGDEATDRFVEWNATALFQIGIGLDGACGHLRPSPIAVLETGQSRLVVMAGEHAVGAGCEPPGSDRYDRCASLGQVPSCG